MAARERWFAEILQAGLDTKLATEQDLLAHATPSVLIGSLPKDVLARVLGGALSNNAISARYVVETAGIPLLAEKVPADIVWACIAFFADRAGITVGAPLDNTGARELIRRALAAALDLGVLTPKDVVEHVDAEVLATCFPDDITTKLLEASLAAGKLNPELIVDTIGVPAIAKHAPVELVWACFVKPGEGLPAKPLPAIASGSAPTTRPETKPETRPEIEVIEDDHQDDVATILVDLEDDVKKPAISAKPVS